MLNIKNSSIEYLINGIKAMPYEPEFDRQITLQIYQWIDMIKGGRMTMSNDLKTLQKDISVIEEDFSLTWRPSNHFQLRSFNKYFGENLLSHVEIQALLKSVDTTEDAWDKLFGELSEQIKTPTLNDQQWLKLESRLGDFSPRDYQFPQITQKDIHKYLPIAVYFFTLKKNHHVSFLKNYINNF
jgi:hypothetical protein